MVRDLTQGSIAKHLLAQSVPMAVGMSAQIAYQLVDLYFIATLGTAAIAGVNASSNVVFGIAAVAQAISVGTCSLVAHAVGRGDESDAKTIYNQSISLAALSSVILMITVYSSRRLYLSSIASDQETVHAGETFLVWVIPGYAITMVTAAMSASLRGAGVIHSVVVIYTLTVILNCVLAPVLIAGWGTGVSFGVMGAGLATTISALVGQLLLLALSWRSESWLKLQWSLIAPKIGAWWRIVRVGLPAGGDLALFVVFNAAVYYLIKDLGAEVQAGFGIGSRILQTMLLPGISICLAAAPIAGQNYGACRIDRVHATFLSALFVGSAAMILTAIIILWQSKLLVGIFDAQDVVRANAENFLKVSSFAIVAQAAVTASSSIFQALGNTLPSLISSCVRLIAFCGVAFYLVSTHAFGAQTVWLLWMGTLMAQAAVSLILVRGAIRRAAVRCAASK
jgi:putative MATE family efflux protein